MPYLGTLVTTSPYTLEVVGTSKVAITVVNIRKDRISEVESLILDGNVVNLQSRTASTNLSRIVFMASAPSNQTAVVKIGQAQKFEVPVGPDDVHIVFDVA